MGRGLFKPVVWALFTSFLLFSSISNAIASCDVGIPLTAQERESLFYKLRISKAGQKLIASFEKKYSSLENLNLQWNTVSYSQLSAAPQRTVSSVKKNPGRGPASVPALSSEMVCVHLARKLPDIEHIADLAHELVHATRLSHDVLVGNVTDPDEFVSARIKSRGGEADAFASECVVKHEILGTWDRLCTPYVSDSDENAVDVELVIRDLYNGELSASLTGEAYPVMLARQFKAMLEK